MRDVLFIQFYAIPQYPPCIAPNTLGQKTALLCNGFSLVWNECRNMGDFLWVKEVPDFTDSAAMMNNRLPITKGRAYVSAWRLAHLVQAIVWAFAYPDIQFTVGGHNRVTQPSAGHPPNLKITEALAEQEIFGMKEVSKKWNLEIPDDVLPEVDNVLFSYTVGRKCYWSKCNFCDEILGGSPMGRFGNDASSLYIPDTRIASKMAFLYDPSLSPNWLKRHYKHLPRRDDVFFPVVCRGDWGEAEALREVFGNGEGPKPQNMFFSIGVEFPSSRMLQWMRKGATLESLLETIKVICEYNSNASMLLIGGFDNLVEIDAVEATNFFNTVREYQRTYGGQIFASMRDLILAPGATLTEEYLQIEEKRKRMIPDSLGGGAYKIALDEQQRELNERALGACREAFPGGLVQNDATMEDKLFPTCTSGRSA